MQTRGVEAEPLRKGSDVHRFGRHKSQTSQVRVQISSGCQKNSFRSINTLTISPCGAATTLALLRQFKKEKDQASKRTISRCHFSG